MKSKHSVSIAFGTPVAVLPLLFGIAGCFPEPDPVLSTDKTVVLSAAAESGEPFSANILAAGTPNAPAIIFVQDSRADLAVWGDFPERLQSIGYSCAVFESQTTSKEALLAVRRALVDSGCDPARIGAIGAGKGADLLLSMAGDGEFVTLVLISARGEGDAEPLMRNASKVPVLIMASEGDSASTARGDELEAQAQGFFEYRVYPGGLYGADLLVGSESAAAQVVQWLEQTLPRRKN